MFFHPEHGLVLSHTRQQFSRLKRGEGFGYIKWRDVASIFDWVVREGKSYAIYPRMKLDRKIVGFIVANYPDMPSNPTCAECGAHDHGAKESRTRRAE